MPNGYRKSGAYLALGAGAIEGHPSYGPSEPYNTGRQADGGQSC